jgi:hypothetical protein
MAVHCGRVVYPRDAEASGEACRLCAGWKKFERFWGLVIRARQLPSTTPLLEAVLSKISADRPLLKTPINDCANSRLLRSSRLSSR